MSRTDTRAIAIIATALILLIVGGTWFLMRRAPAPTNTTPKAVTATEAPIDKPAPPVDLPPLDQMDAYLRRLLQGLSARPELVKWLATDDLIGQLAFAIDAASSGDSPARDFKVVKPIGSFAVAGRGSQRTIDPKSYARYDSLVMTITAIDAARAAQIYKTIKPRLNEAYRKLGHPNGDVDRAVNKSLDILLETPVVKTPIAVVEGSGVQWEYADPRLASLEPSEKQLLRMGPAHVDALLVWLRAFSASLNTP